MSKISLDVTSWNRFRTRYFAVEPRLLGLSHQLVFDECPVCIELPPNDERYTQKEYGPRMIFSPYRMKGTRKVPIEVTVLNVDVRVWLPHRVRMPSTVLNQHPNAYELFSDNEQSYLNGLTVKYHDIAGRAFDLWVRTLRWQSNNGAIGRPKLEGAETGWATYLQDAATRNRIWAGSTVFSVARYRPVTLKEWKKTQRVLEQRLGPPVFYDLFFDGIEHIKLGDLRRAIVDFAIACESFLRTLVKHNLPKPTNESIKKYVDEANIRRVITQFVPNLLKEEEKKALKKIESRLHKLFDARNEILHSGYIGSLTVAECQKYSEVTDSLLAIRGPSYGAVNWESTAT